MNLDEMQKIWAASSNLPHARDSEIIQTFLSKERSRQRTRQAIFITWSLAQVISLTILLGTIALIKDNVSFSQEWGVLILLLLPWSFALYLLVQFKKVSKVADTQSAQAAISTALDETGRAQRHIQMLFAMYAVTIPAIAVCESQLVLRGKMSLHDAVNMTILFLLAIAISAIVMFFKVYRLRKKRDTLVELNLQFLTSSN